MRTGIFIQYNNLQKIAEKLPRAVRGIVRKTAFDVMAGAKEIVPVDTGRLKNSITCEFPSETKAIVAARTKYAGFVENGTSRQRAQPYMRPPAEKAAHAFMAAMGHLEELLL